MYKMNIITITLYIYLLDRVSIVLYKKYGPPGSHVPESARWFFIHAFTNMLICELGYPSLLFCLKNISTCSTSPVDVNGQQAIYTAIILHIYHIVFFYPYLTYNDYITTDSCSVSQDLSPSCTQIDWWLWACGL